MSVGKSKIIQVTCCSTCAFRQLDSILSTLKRRSYGLGICLSVYQSISIRFLLFCLPQALPLGAILLQLICRWLRPVLRPFLPRCSTRPSMYRDLPFVINDRPPRRHHSTCHLLNESPATP
jgi:hypothetical protein